MKQTTKRREYDYYPTPRHTIKNFLENYKIDINAKILEPSAGSGNFIKELQQIGATDITAIEIDQQHKCDLAALLPEKNVIIDNFLTFEGGKDYDVVITNPPYSLAQEFIEKAFNLTKENGVIIMLLRTAFLESQKRFDFWQQEAHKLSGLYTISCRPSFTGKGTDAQSYSWFIWDKRSEEQTIKVIQGK